MLRAASPLLGALLLLAAGPRQEGAPGAREAAPPAPSAVFELPCDGYARALRGKGNFGAYVDPARGRSPFAGTWHLAEDVWVPGGTPVRSVSDGVVVYSDFSPTWTDADGHVHWNLGNVVVIEHALPLVLGTPPLVVGTPPLVAGAPPAEREPEHVCSVYVHLGADRRVQTGERVARGQRIGSVGADRSEENGRYPAHLHFGLHRGPYLQIAPSWRRDLEQQARTLGLPCGAEGELVRGEIELTLLPEAAVRVDFVGTEERTWFSLLTGSTSPGYVPADIAGWCQGYGDEATVAEWLRPSTWIRARRPGR